MQSVKVMGTYKFFLSESHPHCSCNMQRNDRAVWIGGYLPVLHIVFREIVYNPHKSLVYGVVTGVVIMIPTPPKKMTISQTYFVLCNTK